MESIFFGALFLSFSALLGFLHGALFRASKGKISTEVQKYHFLTWYIFCFGFCFMIAYQVLMESFSLSDNIPGFSNYLLKYVRASLDLQIEMSILAGIFLMIVLPQLAAYFFSSFSGSASKPRLMMISTKFLSLWSAKFLAFAGGITLHSAILLPDDVLEFYHANRGPLTSGSIIYLWAAFTILTFYYSGESIIKLISLKYNLRFLARFHSWATRYTWEDESKEPATPDWALMELGYHIALALMAYQNRTADVRDEPD